MKAPKGHRVSPPVPRHFSRRHDPPGGTLRSSFTYDLLGRQTAQSDYDNTGTSVVYSRSASYDAAGKLTGDTSSTVRGGATYVTTSSYTHAVSGEYLLGSLASTSATTYRNGSYDSAATTTNAYVWWDGARQGTMTYAKSGDPTYTTEFVYDGLGTIRLANIKDGRQRRVFYAATTDGQVIRRDEADNTTGTGDPHEIWYRFSGREFGYLTNNGTFKMTAEASITDRTTPGGTAGAFRYGSSQHTSAAEFGHAYEPINSYNQGSGAGGYTVRQTGETLAGIAQALWGDASLWYKLAEVNGLAVEANLVEGQRLTVPAGVMRNTFNAGTVKPYDPASAIGDVSPTTPKPPPPPDNGGCGIGAIFLAIIAIAVTIASAGAFLSAVGAVKGGMLAGMQAFLGIGGVTATGAGAGLAMVGAGVVGGAVGSAVSQGVGIAMGIQDKFSWAGVAMAAIGGGVGGAVGPGGLLGKANGLFSGIGSNVAAAGLRAAVGSAVTQGIGVVTGLQDKFSFAGVAAAAVGGAAGRWAGGGKTDFGSSALSAGATLLANAATRSAIEGTNFGDNILAALPDTIGSLVGNALGKAGVKALADAQSKGASPRIAYEAVDLDDGVTGGQSIGGGSGGGGLTLSYMRAGLGLRAPTIKGVDVSFRTLTGNGLGGAFDFTSDKAQLTPEWADYWKRIGIGQGSATSHAPAPEAIPEGTGPEIVVIAGRAKRHAREREVAQQYNFASITGVNFDSADVQSLRVANPLFVNRGPAQQYMLGDGSLFTGTSAALDRLNERRAFLDKHNKLTTGGFAGLGYGIADAAGASTETANAIFGIGGVLDNMATGVALRPRGGVILPKPHIALESYIRAAESPPIASRGGTYVLRDAEDTIVRSGRTKDFVRREAEHARDPALGQYRFDRFHPTDVYAEQRGLEQILHETYKPQLSKIGGVSPTNPKAPIYYRAARDYLLRHGGP